MNDAFMFHDYTPFAISDTLQTVSTESCTVKRISKSANKIRTLVLGHADKTGEGLVIRFHRWQSEAISGFLPTIFPGKQPPMHNLQPARQIRRLPLDGCRYAVNKA